MNGMLMFGCNYCGPVAATLVCWLHVVVVHRMLVTMPVSSFYVSVETLCHNAISHANSKIQYEVTIIAAHINLFLPSCS